MGKGTRFNRCVCVQTELTLKREIGTCDVTPNSELNGKSFSLKLNLRQFYDYK